MRATRIGIIAALVALALVALAGIAGATPIIAVTVVSNDGTSADIAIDLTTPTEGILAYSFSVSFDGSLTFNSGDRVTPPGMVPLGTFNNGGAGPGIITLITAASAAVTTPVGVGGETFRVANLVFDLNGGSGLVQTGPFFDGVDGFVITPGEFQSDGSFGGANLGLFTFESAHVAVPEPSTALLVQLGVLVLATARRRID